MSQLPLFVYGTLRSDASEGAMLGDRRRESATVRGQLFVMPAGYPAVSLAGNDVVHGELVFGVDEGILSVLDLYEGTNEGLYRRVEVTCTSGLRAVRAVAYVMDDPKRIGGRYLPKGRWRAPRQ